MSRLWPQTLFGRMVLVLLGGFSLAQVLNIAIHLGDRDRFFYQASAARGAQRVADLVRMLDALGPAQRAQVAARLDLPQLQISLDNTAPAADRPGPSEPAAAFRRLLQRYLGRDRQLRVEAGTAAGAPQLTVHTRLADGTWAGFHTTLSREGFGRPYRPWSKLMLLLVAVVVVSLLAVRWVTRPLHVLSSAAEALGEDINRPPLAETGPVEVRRAAHAFNTMQARLARYIEDRTRILAAMSHDLKTPITRLRLRLELLEDSALKDKFVRDLDEMEAMVGATLDFMRGVEQTGSPQPVDVMALLESLQADAEEMGNPVGIEGGVSRAYAGNPQTLKRCIGNLVDNAVNYGKRATIAVADEGECLSIRVRDEGPGIPLEELERVFDPFYRLEGSRNRASGGTGLGLAIARNIARTHGGELTLRNVAGGLEALLTLPWNGHGRTPPRTT